MEEKADNYTERLEEIIGEYLTRIEEIPLSLAVKIASRHSTKSLQDGDITLGDALRELSAKGKVEFNATPR